MTELMEIHEEIVRIRVHRLLAFLRRRYGNLEKKKKVFKLLSKL